MPTYKNTDNYIQIAARNIGVKSLFSGNVVDENASYTV